MTGIGTLLDIGKKSLFANQAAIQVVGNNISNANTEGYSRQAVRFEDGFYINSVPGQLGTGVNAAEVIRYFDEFIEVQYNTKSSEQQRWQALYENLQNVEMLLNESNADGVNSALNAFWADWQTLAKSPDNTSARAALLGHASNLERAIQGVQRDLDKLQGEADDSIAAEVKSVNAILADIADLNVQITVNEETGKNNANGARDQRATLVRKLAEKIDINYIDNGLGNVTITTTAGHTLVDGGVSFRLAAEGPQVITDLKSSSTFVGGLKFEGSGNYEYTVEIVDPGTVASGAATFRVSVDGGRTWMKDASGATELFSVNDYDTRVSLPDGSLSIYFDGSGSLAAGDRFDILPKQGIFWYETTSSKLNVTPQILSNGQDNERRLTGGSLSGLVQFRDAGVGGYLEKLDAFSESLAWEVNRLHSQGTGLDRFTEVIGTYRMTSTTADLGSAESGLFFGDKLEGGNLMVHVYNATTGVLERSQSLDFDTGTAGIQNFDPTSHSLAELRDAFNTIDGITASVEDGRLQIVADSGKNIAFGTDTTGLLAALGMNTFFEGSDARTLAINSTIRSNLSFLNTGHVNGAGEMNSGDNTTAAAIAALQSKAVSTQTVAEGVTRQTLGEYYSTLVAKAGSDTQNAKFNFEYQEALANDLRARQESVSGVNLDEEMTNLIKFQHSYTAAAKLITTAESMLQVLLGLKQ